MGDRKLKAGEDLLRLTAGIEVKRLEKELSRLTGRMDEVAVFARALSEKDVQLLYARGRKGEPLR